MKNVYIVSAKRTAIGNFNGTISALEAHELGATVINNILTSTNIDPSLVSEVILGQVLTAAKGQNPARQASIKAQLPFSVPAYNVAQVCGSGLKAVALGYQAILSGDSSVVIAGGQESMSRALHATYIRAATKMGNNTLVDTMVSDGLTDAFYYYPMGITAENIADKFKISREAQDIFALQSQKKASNAIKNNRFIDEIVPIKIVTRGLETNFVEDEFVKHTTTIDTLNKLRPVFNKDGSVTAGNASGINDGAAALLLVSEEVLIKYNLTPLGRIASWAQAGVEPELMGIGPIPASKMALKKANWQVQDLDLIEANEAFASQTIVVNKEMQWDLEKVNVNGGAIALGHPIGASGARVLVTLIHQMIKSNAKKGLATLCIGGGMGIAMCIER